MQSMFASAVHRPEQDESQRALQSADGGVAEQWPWQLDWQVPLHCATHEA